MKTTPPETPLNPYVAGTNPGARSWLSSPQGAKRRPLSIGFRDSKIADGIANSDHDEDTTEPVTFSEPEEGKRQKTGNRSGDTATL